MSTPERRRVVPRRRPVPGSPAEGRPTPPLVGETVTMPPKRTLPDTNSNPPATPVTRRPMVAPRRRTSPGPDPKTVTPVTPADLAPVTSTRHPLGTPIHTVDEPHVIAPGRVTPPERFDPDGAWSFNDLGSACPTPGLDAANRFDPYWDGLWGTGSAASWLSIDLARRQSSVGLGSLPAELDLTHEEALETLRSSRGWQQRLAMLGAIFSWRTMSVEQTAAFVGDARLTSTLNPSPASLFASGVIDLGIYSNGLRNTDLTGRGAVYRTGKGTMFNTEVKNMLSWAEWISVTGGQRWTPSSNYDRHNMLATELALRLAEYTEVGTVLGERFSSLDHLVGSGLGNPSLAHDQRAADLCAVREDGMRIVFEMTANTGTHFHNKVARWARILAENPLETSGLCVVFVVIQHPERLAEHDGFIPRARTYQAIAAATKEFPGSARDRVAERMGVATWREWFPERGKVHDSFFTLRVDRPTGRGDALWEPADMLSPTETTPGVAARPFVAHDPERMRAILDNAALLGNTPHWLRARRDPPPLWPLLMENAGVTEIPKPTPARPGRTKGRDLGQGVGAARAAKPPARLCGLAR